MKIVLYTADFEILGYSEGGKHIYDATYVPKEGDNFFTAEQLVFQREQRVINEAAVVVQQENIALRAYLASTDWQLLRELDGGQPMSTETKTARATARAGVTS